MITKAVRRHGSRVRGLVEYLFGPGRAEEHTDPHIVAAHTGMLVGDRAGTGAARGVLADELDFHRALLAPDVTERFVFHAAVSMAAEDGALPEGTWRDVAESIAAHLGFTPEEDGGGGGAEVRWVAVHHGLSAAGNDHIHLVANLINSDGRKHRFIRPPGVMLGEVRKTLEIRHGLRQVGHTDGVDHGVGLGPHTRAEVQRADREARTAHASAGADSPALEPESVRLERVVRAAAAGAGSEAAFVAELREQHVVVRPRMAAGSGERVVGYSVALPTGGGGERLLWFGGGRLAKDLTLPSLRARWETGQTAAELADARSTAVPGWRPTGDLDQQRHAAAGHRGRPDVDADLAATRDRIAAVGRWVQDSAGDPAAREAALVAAGFLAAAATRLPPAEQAPFHAAARALARVGQPDRPGSRTTPGGHPTTHPAPAVVGMSVVGAALLHAGTGPHRRAGWIAVYETLAKTAAMVAAAQRSTTAATAELQAVEAAVARVVAFTAAAEPRSVSVVDPARRDTSFPIPLTEQLTHTSRPEHARPLRSSTPLPRPGRNPDHGPDR